MSIRIGLTGGIAAGKSTVAARMRELGALVIDYDGLAHEIVASGGVALPRIAAVFGPDALLATGRSIGRGSPSVCSAVTPLPAHANGWTTSSIL